MENIILKQEAAYMEEIKKEKKVIKNKTGIALILVILLMSVIFSLAAYFLNFSLIEKRISKSQSYGLKTYYLAEAGIQEMIWRLKNIEEYTNNFETNAIWTETFTRTNPFGADSGSYTVSINNSELARGEITSTGTIEVENGKTSQRVVKTSVYRAMGEGSELGDNCGYANGNIDISNSEVNFYNGSAHSNNNFIINGTSIVDIDADLSAVNNYLPSWNSTVTIAGGIYAANMPSGPAAEINMPAVDFDSADPGSLKNSADVIYTKAQFDALLKTTPVVLNNQITYVEGDIDLDGGIDLTVNGLLVSERDIKIGVKRCFVSNEICGSADILVNHTIGQASGLLAKRRIHFQSYSGDIDINGVVYGNDQVYILSLPADKTFIVTGGILARKLTITRIYQPISIVRDEEIINSTLGSPMFSPIITIEHWEEEY